MSAELLPLAEFAVGDDVMIRWGAGDRWERFAIAGAPYPSATGATIVQLVKASTGEVVVRRTDTIGRVPALPRRSHERFGAPPPVRVATPVLRYDSRCESEATIGTGTGVCDTRLGRDGSCPRADTHL